MRIDIYGVRPRSNGEWELDESRPVGHVLVNERKVVSDSAPLRRLFAESACRMTTGDSLESYPAWSREAIKLILEEKLGELSLIGRVQP